MTKEELIRYGKDYLKDLMSYACCSISNIHKEFVKEAIKALEQQPSEDCISRADALRVAKNEYLRGWHESLCKALSEKHSIHCEEGDFRVIQEETILGLGLSMNCALGKDAESYMSTIPSATPKHGTCKDCNLYRPDQYKNMRCQVLDFYPNSDFYCADFEKRGNENESIN